MYFHNFRIYKQIPISKSVSSAMVAIALVLGFVLQIASFNCGAQGIVQAPATAAGNLLASYLVVHNIGDEVSFQNYKKQHYPKLDVDRHLGFREMTGGLDLLRVNANGAKQIIAIVKERDGDQFFQIELKVKPGSSTLATDLKVSGIDPPSDLLPARLSLENALLETDKKADAYFASDDFSGTLMIVRSGQIVHNRSWGLADRERQIPINMETRFRIASMGKMFTAVAVLQLVDDGKLALDQTVGHYLTDYPNKILANQVTLRELLNHTGGTGEIFTPEYMKNKDNVREVSDYLKMFGKRKPEFKPGSKDSYSNYGYMLLGALIEKASGQSYYDYVHQHVWAAAGMENTGARPESEITDQVAIGYIKDEHDKVTTNVDTLPYRGLPAGGAYSTVGDIVKFVQALQQGRLLSKRLLDDATSPQNILHWYGYGFMVGSEGTRHWYGHEGGAPGMNGMLKVYPESDYIVLCLSNADSTAADKLVNFFTYRMPL